MGVYHYGNGTTLSVSDSTGLNSFTSNGATATTGQMGGAAAFSGSNQYMQEATMSSTPAAAMTICTWFQTTKATQQFMASLSRTPSGIANSFYFGLNNSARLNFLAYDSTTRFNLTDAVGLNDGNWRYACFVKNGTSGALYRDGTSTATQTASASVTYSATDLTVGFDPFNNGLAWQGSLDKLDCYQRHRQRAPQCDYG